MVEATRKKALLAPKIFQAHLSNVKESLYLFDHTKVVNQNVRNFVINHQIETLLQSKLYGPVILLSFRNYARDVRFVNQEMQEKFSKEKMAHSTIKVEVPGGPPLMKGLPARKERLTVCKVDNLILLNLSPCLGRADQTSIYDFVRSQAKPQQTIIDIIQAVIAQLSLSQVGLIVDRVELMSALLGSQETLQLIKTIKHQQELGTQANEEQKPKIVYPFFAHVDFSLCPKNTGNFEQKLIKLQNGLFRFEREVKPTSTSGNKLPCIFTAKAYASVVKSGCRFQDELVELQVEVRGNDGQSAGSGLVSLLLDKGNEADEFDMTESIRKKEKAVKASFRIEMTDEERKMRDSQVTNQYYTGTNVANAPQAVQQQQQQQKASAPQITMSKEDEAELEADRLTAIQEDGQRESSDDGDNDDDDDDYDDEDPDDDLNF